jgi:hypothetical protein
MEFPEDERLIDAFGTHWVKYVIPSLVYVLLLSVSVLLFILAEVTVHHLMWLSHVSLFLALFLFLLVHHWFFHRLLSEAMVDIIITSRRLMFLESNIFFRDDMHEVALNNIQGVEAHKHGLLQNFLHYGSLWFDTGGTSLEGGKLIPLVPHPHHRAQQITNLLRLK